MNKPNENPVAAARSAGRNALDESAGKQLLSTYGISVPQSRVAKGVADVDAVMNGLKTPVVVKVMSPDILHKSDAGGVKIKDHQRRHDQITFASLRSFSTRLATSGTLMPALRVGGSLTLIKVKRGEISTLRSAGLSVSMVFLRAFMMFGSDA